MKDVVTKREHGWIRFNEGQDGWSFPDPTSERASEGRHQARYGEPRNFAVAELADALVYLVVECPTTAMAVEKLRAIRKAVNR
jgi:hypothetical protein